MLDAQKKVVWSHLLGVGADGVHAIALAHFSAIAVSGTTIRLLTQ